MTRQIFAAEIIFDDLPPPMRERFPPSEKQVKKCLAEFRQLVDEVYVLATGTKFAVYIFADSPAPLTTFFYDEHSLRGYTQLYYNTGESVAHLMTTASGLLSAVKGDARVLAEVIQCYEWARETASLGPMLDHTVSKAIETGRFIRVRTGIDQFGVSLVDTGIELLYNRVDNLHRRNIIVAGTGTMADQALRSLTGEGLTNIVVTGHSPNRAKALAEKYQLKSFELRDLAVHFPSADIVLALEHTELPLKLGAATEPDYPDHGDRFIIDFGVPPNFDELELERHCAEFYNIDDLRRLQASPLEAFGGVEQAWRGVVKASDEFVRVFQLLNHAPILTAYLARQFYQRGADDNRVRNRRSLRDLLFRRSTRTDELLLDSNTLAQHLNNHVAEDARDVARHVTTFKKVWYYLPDN